MKKLNSNNNLRDAANKFASSDSLPVDIEKAGELTMCILYNGKPGESLNLLRHRKFYEKVSTSSVQVPLQVLPPTFSAT